MTQNLNLANTAQDFVNSLVRTGAYPSTDAYLSELVLRDKAAQEELKALLMEGINSGPSATWEPGFTQTVLTEVRKQNAQL